MEVGKQIEVLNELIAMNSDRIAGYENAIEKLEHSKDLKKLFASMANQSKEFISELGDEVKQLGGSPQQETTISGAIYRTWIDIKAIFGGNDREAVLNACEFGEDTAKKAYQKALTNEHLNEAQREIIRRQQCEQVTAHDKIKLLRNLQ